MGLVVDGDRDGLARLRVAQGRLEDPQRVPEEWFRGHPARAVTAGVDETGAERVFPQRRWGEPDDPARLIAWLATHEAGWITGQVIGTEGGFRRWT